MARMRVNAATSPGSGGASVTSGSSWRRRADATDVAPLSLPHLRDVSAPAQIGVLGWSGGFARSEPIVDMSRTRGRSAVPGPVHWELERREGAVAEEAPDGDDLAVADVEHVDGKRA